ncbi:MAG: hypothetical protein ACRELY_21435 [Polyangiaceae bacterium]
MAIVAAAVGSISCGAKILQAESDAGNTRDAGCECRLPNGDDDTLVFCDRVCNGTYTDWVDPFGKVCLHEPCPDHGACAYYASSGSAYCQ